MPSLTLLPMAGHHWPRETPLPPLFAQNPSQFPYLHLLYKSKPYLNKILYTLILFFTSPRFPPLRNPSLSLKQTLGSHLHLKLLQPWDLGSSARSSGITSALFVNFGTRRTSNDRSKWVYLLTKTIVIFLVYLCRSFMYTLCHKNRIFNPSNNYQKFCSVFCFWQY